MHNTIAAYIVRIIYDAYILLPFPIDAIFPLSINATIQIQPVITPCHTISVTTSVTITNTETRALSGGIMASLEVIIV